MIDAHSAAATCLGAFVLVVFALVAHAVGRAANRTVVGADERYPIVPHVALGLLAILIAVGTAVLLIVLAHAIGSWLMGLWP